MSFVGPNGAVEEYKDPVVENLLHLYTFYYCNAGDLAVCLRLLYELTAWLAFTETYREAIQKAPPLAWRVLDYYSNVNFITYSGSHKISNWSQYSVFRLIYTHIF